MNKYKSKPVEIDAVQWNGDFELANLHKEKVSFNAIEEGGPYLCIHTLEGIMRLSPGDWLIRGTEGELYPCKDSVFQRKYEKVE